jgi:hypothetical protein
MLHEDSFARNDAVPRLPYFTRMSACLPHLHRRGCVLQIQNGVQVLFTQSTMWTPRKFSERFVRSLNAPRDCMQSYTLLYANNVGQQRHAPLAWITFCHRSNILVQLPPLLWQTACAIMAYLSFLLWSNCRRYFGKPPSRS